MVVAAIFGLVIGAFLGLLGAGGSILAIPALVYGVGLPLHSAIPTSLLVVALSAFAGLIARWRSNVIRWPVLRADGRGGGANAHQHNGSRRGLSYE
jgi:uncharacterized protein